MVNQVWSKILSKLQKKMEVVTVTLLEARFPGKFMSSKEFIHLGLLAFSS